MKTIVLFASPGPKPFEKGHFRRFKIRGKQFWVRAEESTLELSDALEKAKPRDGETILNSIEV